MEKTGTDIVLKARFLLYAIVVGVTVIAITILTVGLFDRQHNRQMYLRKAGFVNANKLVLYESIRFLEKNNNRNIAELIQEAEQNKQYTNINAMLVYLFAANRISSPVTVSNVGGSEVFVDPWGIPYKFTITNNDAVPKRVGVRIESRILIESIHMNEQ